MDTNTGSVGACPQGWKWSGGRSIWEKGDTCKTLYNKKAPPQKKMKYRAAEENLPTELRSNKHYKKD